MPNLINVLRPAWENGKKKKMSEDERRKQIEKELKGGGDKAEKAGMEWGTCMIFSCGKDCAIADVEGEKDAWREEKVYVQWDV